MSTHASPSPFLYYPRWVNPKNGQENEGKVSSSNMDDGEEVQTGDEVRAGLGDSEDEGSTGSPSDSTPPSSSGGKNSSDGSDPPNTPPSDSSSPPPTPIPPPTPPSQGSIAKQSVPEIYPQVLALPIARRPLFPGFYKAVVVRNPSVVSAIKEMMARGQPYLGAFLLKDENTDSDIISDINSVHPVGVFAQITSVFAASGGSGKDDEKDEGLTAVLYPHRRIKITELIKAGGQPIAAKVEQVEGDETLQEPLPTPPPSPELKPKEDLAKIPPSNSSLLHKPTPY
jgi:ATP-dependent Lon protease